MRLRKKEQIDDDDDDDGLKRNEIRSLSSPYLELVVFGEAKQVAALHREQVLHCGLADADHFEAWWCVEREREERTSESATAEKDKNSEGERRGAAKIFRICFLFCREL